jgi:hypothetical protein
LTEHSRATDGCEKRDAIPMDGFNKDQERALKCRKAMFQANTEEEKWKHVYLILFPDAVLGEIPSPCKLDFSPGTQRLIKVQITT